MRPHLSGILALLLAGPVYAEPASVVHGQADPAYLAELRLRVEELDLGRSHGWRVLGHYKGRAPGQWLSQADGEDFFLSPDGADDPEAELQATLAAFFLPPPPPPAGEPSHLDQHPQCRFPRRYAWLDEQLGFDPERLPKQGCPELEDWKQRLGATRVTLVFADAYINNPASMFGHTFLRLDKAQGGDLLANTVNFSAEPWTSNPFIYPIAGIVGWFPGTYATIPYYLKVREYNALENRDLWEYPLDIDAEELDRLLDHLWEIGPVVFRYHYFDENCSYQLLALLEAMDPSLRLTDRYSAWVFPTATLRAVTAKTDLVQEPDFRPSMYRELIARRDALLPDERRLARSLARSLDELAELETLEAPRQAAVLDAAWELQRYRAAGEPDPAQRAHDQALLVARRRVSVTSEAPVIPTPDPPERGHRGGMSALGVGQGPQGSFARLRLRAAMHDPLASQQSYVPGTRLEMGHLSLRLPLDSGVPSLEHFILFDAASLAPSEPWITRMAWRLRTGWEQQPFTEQRGDCQGRGCIAYGVSGGPGLAGKLGPLLAYGFFEGEAALGAGVGRHLRLGPGAAGGFVLGPPEGIRMLVEGRARYPLWSAQGLFPGAEAIEVLVEGGIAAHLRTNLELRGLGRLVGEEAEGSLEVWMNW